MTSPYVPTYAEVVDVARSGEVTRTIVTATDLRSPAIAPASLCRSEPERKEILQLHKLVAQHGNELTFETYGHTGELPLKGERLILQSWWSDDQLDVAHSAPSRWRKERFKPNDAIAFRGSDGATWVRAKEEGEDIPPKAEVVPGGWDHAHCRLCWRHLCADPDCNEDGDREGYTDGSEWVCEVCYARFILSGFGQKLG